MFGAVFFPDSHTVYIIILALNLLTFRLRLVDSVYSADHSRS